jgi:uncharacterized RDD family membrane protein YckC
MKTKNNPIPNEIPDFIDERDVFGLVNPKRIEDHKTFNSMLNDAPPRLKVQYARLSDRIIAFVIDLIIVLTFLAVMNEVFIKFIPNYNSHRVSGYLIAAIVWIIYNGIFDSSFFKATIGKMIFKLKVIDRRSKRVHFLKATLRCIIAIITILPLGFGIWGVPKDRQKQGLHDKIMDCYVIKI